MRHQPSTSTWSLGLLALTALAGGTTQSLAQAQTQTQTQAVQIVKIGHVGPMSGSQAHFGRDNENGARLAIDELNAQNVVIGGKKNQI